MNMKTLVVVSLLLWGAWAKAEDQVHCPIANGLRRLTLSDRNNRWESRIICPA
jgi:hypothetical protein